MKIFADGADLASILALASDPRIDGFTTNPTLMRRAGVEDYCGFARDVLAAVGSRPVSFEVFADDLDEMLRQGLLIGSWGPNVYVKIPVTNTLGEPTSRVIKELSSEGVHVNVTAMMTLEQVEQVLGVAADGPEHVISVFAGRIADTCRDPLPVMRAAVELLRPHPQLELLWASPREVLNVAQAESAGVHIITLTDDLLAKLGNRGRDLEEFSLDTVKMFRRDAVAAGYRL